MNFSKSILTVAMLVSVSAASALPGVETAKALWAKVPTRQEVWAKVPSRTEVGELFTAKSKEACELFAAKSYDVKQVVAPYMTKRVAAVATAAGVITAGSVVAYKKGYFGKAAQAVVNFGSAVKAKFTAKK